jgi:hypothetical protein
MRVAAKATQYRFYMCSVEIRSYKCWMMKIKSIVKHVARMWQMRNAYIIIAGNPAIKKRLWCTCLQQLQEYRRKKVYHMRVTASVLIVSES